MTTALRFSYTGSMSSFKKAAAQRREGYNMTEVTVRIGSDRVIPGRVINGITYVPLRDVVEAIQPRVVWTPEEGAGVIL
jgi:sporulation-control protein spo0M